MLFLGDTITPKMSMDVAENLDTFINDSIWEDVLDNFIPRIEHLNIQNFPDMFNYLNTHDTSVSEWEKTVVEMLATGDKNLFEEITMFSELLALVNNSEFFLNIIKIYRSRFSRRAACSGKLSSVEYTVYER